MFLGIGLRWVVRGLSIFFGLIVLLLYAYKIPLLNWLWDIQLVQGIPGLLLLGISGFFFLGWIWPGGRN